MVRICGYSGWCTIYRFSGIPTHEKYFCVSNKLLLEVFFGDVKMCVLWHVLLDDIAAKSASLHLNLCDDWVVKWLLSIWIFIRVYKIWTSCWSDGYVLLYQDLDLQHEFGSTEGKMARRMCVWILCVIDYN